MFPVHSVNSGYIQRCIIEQISASTPCKMTKPNNRVALLSKTVFFQRDCKDNAVSLVILNQSSFGETWSRVTMAHTCTGAPNVCGKKRFARVHSSVCTIKKLVCHGPPGPWLITLYVSCPSCKSRIYLDDVLLSK